MRERVHGPLIVERFVLGPFETNCYLLRASAAPSAVWMVDAGFDPEPLLKRIESLGLPLAAVLLTHAHADHIAGLGQVKAAHPQAPILVHPAERAFLTDPTRNLSAGFGLPVTAPPADGALEEGQTLDVDGAQLRVLHTPGHSPGGVTLHAPEAGAALVGDTLFAGSIGRFDFPTSDERALFSSIQDRLYALPEETVVYSGHGPPTTIGAEKRSNPFVRGA